MFNKYLAFLMCVLALGCSETRLDTRPIPSTEPHKKEVLEFKVCGPHLPGLECAYPQVDKDRKTEVIEEMQVRVGLLRSFSLNPSGAVFINPGGPGSSAVKFLSAVSGNLSELRKHYDVYAIDPRGTEGTAPINCPYDLFDIYNLDVTPDSKYEADIILSQEKSYTDSCVKSSGAFISYVSSHDSASDMADIADMMEFKELNYIGFSYGSELGAIFASMYPEKVGRFVFDGASDFRKSPMEGSLEQGRGFENSLLNFLSRCDEKRCFKTGSRDVLNAALDSVESGFVSYGDRTLNSGAFYIGLASMLYSPNSDSLVAEGLREALDGSANTIGSAFQSYLTRDQDGQDDGSLDAYRAIMSSDGYTMTIQEQEQLLSIAKKELPFFWPVFVQPVPRIDPWPSSPVLRPKILDLPKNKVMYIAATGDPATTYKDTAALASDSDSVLLTRTGFGHTSYFFSDCVKKEVLKFIQGSNEITETCETND